MACSGTVLPFYIILLHYLSGTPLGDTHILAITTYHVMYLIYVKIQ
jgi:hypothetical protein